MRYPLENLQPDIQKKGFIVLLILTVLIMLITNSIGAALMTPEAPSGIVSFELAFTPARAQQMISSWSLDAQLRASFIQGLDFLFPLVYSMALGLGCLLSARVLSIRRKPLAKLGGWLASGLFLAAVCDYIENVALVTELFGRVETPFPEIAGVCAVIKFSLIILSILYILYALLIRLATKPAFQSAT